MFFDDTFAVPQFPLDLLAAKVTEDGMVHGVRADLESKMLERTYFIPRKKAKDLVTGLWHLILSELPQIIRDLFLRQMFARLSQLAREGDTLRKATWHPSFARSIGHWYKVFRPKYHAPVNLVGPEKLFRADVTGAYIYDGGNAKALKHGSGIH
jgi:hypothetical protein